MDRETMAAASLLAAAAALPRLARADDEEALDAEFLDYLGTLEGEQEDWTWFSDDESKPEDRAPADDDASKDTR